MHVARWMKHPVHHIKPRDSIRHARTLLEEHRINQLPVVVDGRVVGMVTDRDLRDAWPSLAEIGQPPTETNPDRIPVEDVMSHNVLTIGPEAAVEDAVHLLRRERIGALPIVEHGRLIGILTRSDVLDAFLGLVALAPR